MERMLSRSKQKRRRWNEMAGPLPIRGRSVTKGRASRNDIAPVIEISVPNRGLFVTRFGWRPEV